MKESTDLEILLLQEVAVIDVNQTAGLFYVGKVCAFDEFQALFQCMLCMLSY